jgi:hypothetical protein
MRLVEEAVRRALGYQDRLPLAFAAVGGLVLSPLLAGLSILFRRYWGDARLARHCHYLGVPFAVGACLLSAFEPRAAVICLSGYAALFALAVAVFAAPEVIYLATATLAGAVYFGSTLWPGTTLADRAFLGAVIGLGYWLVGFVLEKRGTNPAYRRPLDHAALVLSALAVVGGAVAAVPPQHVPLAAA